MLPTLTHSRRGAEIPDSIWYELRKVSQNLIRVVAWQWVAGSDGFDWGVPRICRSPFDKSIYKILVDDSPILTYISIDPYHTFDHGLRNALLQCHPIRRACSFSQHMAIVTLQVHPQMLNLINFSLMPKNMSRVKYPRIWGMNAFPNTCWFQNLCLFVDPNPWSHAHQAVAQW